MSIEVRVLTVMVFESPERLEYYLTSDVHAEISGFADEIRQVWRSGESIEVITPRINYGAVVTTSLTVEEKDGHEEVKSLPADG